MAELSKDRLYESAARTRDALSALAALRNQGVFEGVTRPTLAVAVAPDRLGFLVQLMVVSDGVLIAAPAVLCDSVEFETHEVVASVLLSQVPSFSVKPVKIVSNVSIDKETLEALSLKEAPRSGRLAGLLELCLKNASIGLKRERTARLSSRDAVTQELMVLKETLSLPTIPLRIECLDISHHHGAQTTAAFAVLKEGLPSTKLHRSLNINTGNNDVLSVKTAVTRRIEILRKQQSLPVSERDVSLSQTPDLLLIDGGRPQLDAALEALEALGFSIPVASLAKHLEEVFLPDSKHPLRLDLTSPALYVLQRARDAAHDLSIRRSRARRLKDMTRTGLEGIPGLGQKRLRRLLEELSVKELSEMTVDEMPSYLPLATREAILQRLKINTA